MKSGIKAIEAAPERKDIKLKKKLVQRQKNIG